MNSKLKELITPQTVLSYSSACIEVCNQLLFLKNENYQRLVIPSRGAYPFYTGAQSSLHFLTQDPYEIVDFKTYFNLWLMPYTSDWGDADIQVNSLQIRRFWTKVMSDFIKKVQTPYSNFYSNLVSQVGEQYNINTSFLTLDKFYKEDTSTNEKFIFIDTAVSGKAITEIIESFYEFHLTDFYIILLTDENGSKLKPDYKKIIEREKRKDKLFEINVEKIFSEDASPLLNSGIASLVFPNLIESAYNKIPEFKHNEIIGGGLWFIDAGSHLVKSAPNLNSIRGSVATMIFSGLRENFKSGDKFYELLTKTNVEMMIEQLGTFNIFDSTSTKSLIKSRLLTNKSDFEESVDVTGSHVVRINLKQNFIKKFITSIERK